jgi:molybdate transport system substrate-binding protein
MEEVIHLKTNNLSAFFMLILIVTGVACGSGDHSNENVLVFAATSLTDALDQTIADFEAQTDSTILVSYGGSQSLAQQIVSGAPADIFISAGKFPVEFLEVRQVAIRSKTDLLSNKLVLVTEGRHAISDLSELTSDSIKRLAIANPDLAPAGAYSRESLVNLGLWDDLQTKMVFGADVRATMAYVESGNADVAFVYQTDTTISKGLTMVDAVPTDSYSQIVYPILLLERGENNKTEGTADGFFNFLSGNKASGRFQASGFTILSSGN